MSDLGLIRSGWREAGLTWDPDVTNHVHRPPTEDERCGANEDGFRLANHALRSASELSAPQYVVEDDGLGVGFNAGGMFSSFYPDDPIEVSEHTESHAAKARVYKSWVGHLYFMHRPDGLIKIGRSSNPWRRRAAIQNELGVFVYFMYGVTDGGDLEKPIHKMFKDARRVGEWFEQTEAIRELVRRVGESCKRRRCSREQLLSVLAELCDEGLVRAG